ncbi:MAG: peptidoglycan-binding protein [Saprospiraceae bacterium]|nr:peptidoglycan-binding protein [Saprospiraceae bacterium]
MPTDKRKFLEIYHAALAPALQNKLSFRDEADGAWQPFSEVPGASVKALQQFLKEAGFMPKASLDGIFGYATQAGVRLFQEYIRTVEGDASIGTPDGVAGANTMRFVEKWKAEKQGKPDFVCKWGQSTAQAGSPEFNKWISLLQKAMQHYAANLNHPSYNYRRTSRETPTPKKSRIGTPRPMPSTSSVSAGTRRNLPKSEKTTTFSCCSSRGWSSSFGVPPTPAKVWPASGWTSRS